MEQPTIVLKNKYDYIIFEIVHDRKRIYFQSICVIMP